MNRRIKRLSQIRTRLHCLSRDAHGRYQSQEEIDRERKERRRSGLLGVAGGAAITGGAAAVAGPAIGTVSRQGAAAVGSLLKHNPLRSGRVLAGGALARALRHLR